MPIGENVVYVVDDDPAVRDAVCWLMKTVSLPTRAFGCADEFLESVQADPAGCVITDVRIPGMSGLDLQKKLVERYPDLPVIVITGHGDIEMAVRAMKSGAFDFIQKPFNDQELVDCVHRAIEKSAVIDQRKSEGSRTRCQDSAHSRAFSVKRRYGNKLCNRSRRSTGYPRDRLWIPGLNRETPNLISSNARLVFITIRKSQINT
jgi:FixJ family two-component response regulator